MEKVGEQGRRLEKAELGIWAVSNGQSSLAMWERCCYEAAVQVRTIVGNMGRSSMRTKGVRKRFKICEPRSRCLGSGMCEPQLAAASLILDRISLGHWSTEVNIVRKSWHVRSSW